MFSVLPLAKKKEVSSYYNTLYYYTMMKRFTLILLLLVPCVSSFIANTKVITSVSARQPLFLHVQQIHDHRDTLVKLDDPIMITDDSSVKNNDKSIHSFTNHVAPIVLALYFLGHYLNSYHTPLTDGRVHIIDPMFGGGIMIGAGLYLLNSSIDATFLSPS